MIAKATEMMARATEIIKVAEAQRGGDDKNGDDIQPGKDTGKTKAEKQKAEAHARYMRYYRNIRRPYLTSRDVLPM